MKKLNKNGQTDEMSYLKVATRLFLCALIFIGTQQALQNSAMAQNGGNGVTGLPLPRFVSLKADRVNVRVGPTQDHNVSWQYIHLGLPVEIIQEFENWRQIRDWEGRQGWVFHSLLSGRRTALVTPWEKSNRTPLRAEARSDANIVAELEPFVLASVSECVNGWCKVSGEDYSGWLDQTRLFGVYPDEVVER